MFLQFLQFLHLLGVRHVEVCREILIASQRQEKDDEEVVKTLITANDVASSSRPASRAVR